MRQRLPAASIREKRQRSSKPRDFVSGPEVVRYTNGPRSAASRTVPHDVVWNSEPTHSPWLAAPLRNHAPSPLHKAPERHGIWRRVPSLDSVVLASTCRRAGFCSRKAPLCAAKARKTWRDFWRWYGNVVLRSPGDRSPSSFSKLPRTIVTGIVARSVDSNHDGKTSRFSICCPRKWLHRGCRIR
jgi:hypothetical protein